MKFMGPFWRGFYWSIYICDGRLELENLVKLADLSPCTDQASPVPNDTSPRWPSQSVHQERVWWFLCSDSDGHLPIIGVSKSLAHLEGATETSSHMPRSLEAAGCTVEPSLGHDPNVCHLRLQMLIEKVQQFNKNYWWYHDQVTWYLFITTLIVQ